MQEILLKIRYSERGLSKSLKKVKFIFSFEPSPFQAKLSKTKMVGNSSTNPLQVMKQLQKNSFIHYILSDQVWWCNVKQFLSYSKNYICKFMQSIHDIKNYSTSTCPFESGKCGKERKIWIWIIWISWEQEELFRWNKNIFYSF